MTEDGSLGDATMTASRSTHGAQLASVDQGIEVRAGHVKFVRAVGGAGR